MDKTKTKQLPRNVQDLNQRCRICLSKKRKSKDLFSIASIGIISDAIKECTSVHISRDDKMPSIICCICFKQLKIAFKFKSDCLKSDSLLRQLVTDSLRDLRENTPAEIISVDNNLLTNNTNKSDTDETSVHLDDYTNSQICDEEIINEELKPTARNERKTLSENIINKSAGKVNCICKICDTSYKCVYELKLHIQVHKIDNSYQCDVCKKLFSSVDSLATHRRSHTNETPFMCDICGRSFKYTGNLIAHKRIHTGEKPYECHVCKNKFAQLSSLKWHMLTHTGERPYVCDICNRDFPRRSNLNVHKRTHTGVKPFTCEICTKSYASRGFLNQHKKMHTGALIYQCDICVKSFQYQSSLSAHKKQLHSGLKQHSCPFCAEKFESITELRVHKKTHKGERVYKCEQCEKMFKTRGARHNHSKKPCTNSEPDRNQTGEYVKTGMENILITST